MALVVFASGCLGFVSTPADLTILERVALVTALALVLGLALLLPAPRPPMKLPLLWSGLYLATLVVRTSWPSDTPLWPELLPASLFFLSASLGHSVLLLMHRLVRRHAKTAWLAQLFPLLVAAVYGFAVVIAAKAAGASTLPLLAAAAVALGLCLWASQDPLRDWIAGLSLRAEGVFAPGDPIQLGADLTGIILKLGWRATTLVLADGTEVVIPNRRLAEGVVRRFSRREPWAYRSITVACPLEASPARVRKVILDALRDCPGVSREPAPVVLTQSFAEGGIHYCARFQANSAEVGENVDSTVRDLIWYVLDRHGIPLAHPTSRVHVSQESLEAEARKCAEVVAAQKTHLRLVDVFADLPDEALTELAGVARTLGYTRGELIVQQGDEGDELFVIHAGEVVVTKQTPEGKEQEKTRLGPGQFFGEMALLTGAPRSATVRATQECELIVLTKKGFGSILEKNPSLVAAMRQILEDRKRQNEQDHPAGDDPVGRFETRYRLRW